MHTTNHAVSIYWFCMCVCVYLAAMQLKRMIEIGGDKSNGKYNHHLVKELLADALKGVNSPSSNQVSLFFSSFSLRFSLSSCFF